MDGTGLTAIRARVYVVEGALCIFREMTSGRHLTVLFLIVNTLTSHIFTIKNLQLAL